jgi:hypothetical protein
MGNFFGIFSDIGKSIGTADTMQRQGKVLKNAAKGAANGVRKFFKNGNHNPFKDVGNSAKKFVNGFGKGLLGPRRETTRKMHRESVPTSVAGFVGSIAAHELLRKQKRNINGKSNRKSKNGSFLNRFKKKSDISSESEIELTELPKPQQNNPPNNLTNNNKNKRKTQLQELQPQEELPQPQQNNRLNNKNKRKTQLQELQPQEELKPQISPNNLHKITSSTAINQAQQQIVETQKGGNKKKSSKKEKNISENKKKTSKK